MENQVAEQLESAVVRQSNKQSDIGSSIPQSNLRFGGIGPTLAKYSNSLLPALPIFAAIESSFLVSFCTQDVLGLWMPRIGVSLNRGSIPYDPLQDPSNKDLPLPQLVTKTFINKAKGLNWPNFIEETWRESITGPCMFMIPAILLPLYRGLGVGTSGVKTSFGEMTQFSKKLQDHFQNVDSLSLTPEKYKHQFQTLLTDLIEVDPTKARTKMVGNPLSGWSGKTLQEAVDNWAKASAEAALEKINHRPNPLSKLAYEFRWVGQVLKSPITLTSRLIHGPTETTLSPLEKAEQSLKDRVVEFNRYFIDDMGGVNKLPKLDQVTVNLADDTLKGTEKSIGSVLNNVRQLQYIGAEAFHQKGKQIKNYMRSPAMALKPDTMGPIIKSIYEGMTKREASFAFLSTTLSWAFLWWWSREVQKKHTRYPANRLLQLSDLYDTPNQNLHQNPARTALSNAGVPISQKYGHPPSLFSLPSSNNKLSRPVPNVSSNFSKGSSLFSTGGLG